MKDVAEFVVFAENMLKPIKRKNNLSTRRQEGGKA